MGYEKVLVPLVLFTARFYLRGIQINIYFLYRSSLSRGCDVIENLLKHLQKLK